LSPGAGARGTAPSARVPLGRPETGEEEARAVAEVLASGRLVQGPRTEAFEAALAERVGTRHAVCVSSGTAALHLAAAALGLGPGDRAVVPDFTFPATGNVVRLLGAEPLLADVGLEDFSLDTEDAARRAEAAGGEVRLLVPVHLFGLMGPAEPVAELARWLGADVLEDAACALGAERDGVRAGTMGRAAVLSFHPRKILTTGEGGAVLTDDDGLAKRVRRLRNHGAEAGEGGLTFVEPGFNYRMSEVAAAVGLVQLGKLDGMLARRREIAAVYRTLLAALPVLVPDPPEAAVHTYQSYVILLPEEIDRDAVRAAMDDRGVETSIGTYALSLHPAFAAATGPPPARSHAAYRRSVSLPMHGALSDADVDRTVRALASALDRTVGTQ
jgi:dTDP-4-amino-4,6-dideoxygalactose transaminase